MPTAKKTPNGKWRARVVDHYEIVNGKRRVIHQSFTADTKHEAEHLALMWELENDKIGDSISVKHAVEQYIDSRTNISSPSTIRSYKYTARHSFEAIQNVRISALTSVNLQRWINIRAKGKSPKTVKNEMALLRASCRYFGTNLPPVSLPKATTVRYILPTDANIREMLEYCHENAPEIERAIMLAAFGTLRRGEICALTKDKVFDDHVLVDINHVHGMYGEVHEKDTKTYTSTRRVPLPPEIIATLRKADTEHIVPLSPNALTDKFERIRTKLNLPRFRLHDLRHYAASKLITKMPKNYVESIGGWKPGSKVLESVYINVLSDEEKRMAEIARNIYSEVTEKPSE